MNNHKLRLFCNSIYLLYKGASADGCSRVKPGGNEQGLLNRTRQSKINVSRSAVALRRQVMSHEA